MRYDLWFCCQVVSGTVRGWGCPRGGGAVNFYTYVGSGYFWGFKILNFNIFGVFRNINIFWGMKILWIFLGGHHKNGLYLRVMSTHFRVF